MATTDTTDTTANTDTTSPSGCLFPEHLTVFGDHQKVAFRQCVRGHLTPSRILDVIINVPSDLWMIGGRVEGLHSIWVNIDPDVDQAGSVWRRIILRRVRILEKDGVEVCWD